MDRKNIKVVVFPWWANHNPYLNLLYSPLKGSNVDIIPALPCGIFSFLRNYLRYKPQIFHIHWHYAIIQNSGFIKTFVGLLIFIFEIIILKILDVKIVWTVHELRNLDNTYPFLQTVAAHFLFLFVDKIIVHGETAKEIIKKDFIVNKDKIKVIPHGNYISCYKNNISREEARKRLKINKSSFVFCFFGKIRPYKGIEKLIEEFGKIQRKDIELIIAGPAINEEIEKEIEKLSKKDKRIKLFIKFISSDAQEYFNSADVIVLPYREVLVSGTVFLALSFGKPLIAPKMGCLQDILDEKGSFLYEQDGLYEVLTKALYSKNLSERGEHNLKIAKSLDWEKIAGQTYGVYKELLK